jgi:type IV pilus assembly protein PilM
MSGVRLFQSSPPDVAIEIDASHVAAVRLAWRGEVASIAGYGTELLGAGLVTPGLAAANITDVAEVGRTISQVLSRLGSGRIRRAALVIPDTVAKVSLIRFDTVPPRAADLQELVRWQIRKSAPFPLEQATVSYTPGSLPAEGGQEFVVTVARTDIIEQYEQACERAGVYAGLVDLSTFSIINSVLAGNDAPAGDWLFVHAATSYTTLTVLRGGNLIFFRNRAEDAEGTLADVVHQTAMYYEDRLKGAGFSRVLLAGSAVSPGATDGLRRSLEERLGITVQAIEPTTRASLAGVLLRERKAA